VHVYMHGRLHHERVVVSVRGCPIPILAAGSEKQTLASYLTKVLSPRLRSLLDPGKGYQTVLDTMLAPSAAKDCVMDMLCNNVVSVVGGGVCI
jgi:hypothetical protein